MNRQFIRRALRGTHSLKSLRRRAACGGLVAVLLLLVSNPASRGMALEDPAAPGPSAFECEDDGSEQSPDQADCLFSKTPRKPASGSWERSREKAPEGGSARELLNPNPVKPCLATRLQFCAEYTKPKSIKIGLLGTPKNHRSPPL